MSQALQVSSQVFNRASGDDQVWIIYIFYKTSLYWIRKLIDVEAKEQWAEDAPNNTFRYEKLFKS